jgi:hypothetical protein
VNCVLSGPTSYDELFRCHIVLFDGPYPSTEAVAAAYRECLKTAMGPAPEMVSQSVRWWVTVPDGDGAWGEHRQGLINFAELLAKVPLSPQMTTTTKVLAEGPLGFKKRSKPQGRDGVTKVDQ